MEKTVTIDLGQRSYDVRIAVGLLDAVGQTVASMRNVSRVVVITDDRVEKLYARGVLDSLRAEQLPATLISFASGEINKNLKTYAMLFDKLFAVAPPIDRDSVIVALGGGVVGDVAGFVAATALRGLRWMQCPTTLLADVDASVGGKTAVDHAAGKNLIGAFHQPGAVLIDVETLRTTSEQVMQSGLSECVKHGVIRDAGLLDFIEENLDRILTRDADVMTELIARNVAIKGAVVSADERESAQRAHLDHARSGGSARDGRRLSTRRKAKAHRHQRRPTRRSDPGEARTPHQLPRPRPRRDVGDHAARQKGARRNRATGLTGRVGTGRRLQRRNR